MNPKEFYTRVVELRKWQRQYAKSKGTDKFALAMAAAAEQAIDLEIERVARIEQEKRQPRLNL